jgi:thiamine-phosphate pyrophosphorylase
LSPAELAERLRLIVIADPSATGGRPLVEVARKALAGGASALQLRCKSVLTLTTVELGQELRKEADRYGALFFVNDRIDVALAVSADGAHLGNDDLPLRAARAMTPPGFLLGHSVDDASDVRPAIASGADYLGVGPVRPTRNKRDAGPPIGVEGVARVVVAAGSVPVVAIGGIGTTEAGAVSAVGAAGVAVIGSVMGAADPAEAAKAILLSVQRERSVRLS